MQIYLLYPLFLNIYQHLTLLAVELKPQNCSILHAQELRFVGHWIDFSAMSHFMQDAIPACHHCSSVSLLH